MNNQGWICPKCETIFSPTVQCCFYCKHVKENPNMENIIRQKYGKPSEESKLCRHRIPTKLPCRKCENNGNGDILKR